MFNSEVGIENGYFGIYKWDQKLQSKVFVKKGKAVYLNCIKEQIETDTKKIVLEYYYKDKKQTLEIERGELLTASAGKLLNYGVDAFEDVAKILIKSIYIQEDKAQTFYEHTGLGWYQYQDTLMFRGHKTLCESSIKVESEYKGNLSITPKGSYKEWKAMIDKEVLGHVPLECALIFGLSSILNGYLAKENSYESLLIHIFGESSSGKTTACELAISTAGEPRFNVNGLMNTWNNTDNYSMAILRDNKGMPVLFDEASIVTKKDFTNSIYTLVAGKEKGRMNKDLTLRDSATWCTTILSTGEHSLSSKSNRNTGLQVRNHEFGNVNWTKSAQNADAIKSCVRNNYGYPALKLAKYLITQSYEDIKDKYYECIDEYLMALSSKDEFSNRIAKKQGILLLTAKIVRESLNIDINVDGILTFLIEAQEDVVENRDMALKAYELILDNIKINENKFYKNYLSKTLGTDVELTTPKGEVWGEINNRPCTDNSSRRQEVVIIPQIMEKILSDGGFSEHKVVLRKLRERGYLDCEKGKLKRKRKIQGTSNTMPVYVLNVEIEDAQNKAKSEYKSMRKPAQILRSQRGDQDDNKC